MSVFARSRLHPLCRTLSLVAMLAACGGSSPREPGAAPRAPLISSELHDPELHVEVAGPLLPPMPLAVTSFGAARDERHLYVLGGYAGTPHAYSSEGQSRSLWRLALDGSEGWTELTRMERGLQGLSLLAHGGRVCRFGGTHIRNARGAPTRMESLAEAACFDPSGGGWSALPSLPSGRSSHESARIGNVLYVVGGWRLQGEPQSGVFHGDMLTLDLAAPGAGWTSIALPFRRRALGVASCAGKLLAIGGIDEQGQSSRQVDIFDPQTQQWTRGPDFPADAFGLAATSDERHVYASARDGVVYRLALLGTAWERVDDLLFPRFFHQLIAHGDELIAVGGIGGMHDRGRTRHVERLPLVPRPPSVASVQLDFPGSAKNRYALFVHDDFLYLFGGNNSLEQHDFAPHNFVREGHRLHLPSLRWERTSDFPAARQTMQLAKLDGKVVAVGGFGHDGQKATTQSDVFTFDLTQQTWSAAPALPAGRTQFGLTSHDGALWIFGGLNYDPARPEAFDHVRSVLRASAGGSFEPVGVELPSERRAFAGVTVGGRYYMVGGMRDDFAEVTSCSVFDFASRAFSEFPCPAHPRVSGDLVAIGERLFMASGMARSEQGLTANRSIETLDLRAPEPRWQTLLEQLPFDTRHMRALAHRERILLVSTHLPTQRIQLAWVHLGGER